MTEEVKQRRSLGNGAGKWVKYKLPDQSLSQIRKFCGEVRAFHYACTAPWDEGLRLLSGKANTNYQSRMAEFQTKFGELVDLFVAKYPELVKDAKKMHGPTYEPSDYPSQQHLKSTFHFGVETFPVPKPEHFTADMKDLYGHALVALTEKKIQDANADTWERLMKPVLIMAEKLASPDAIFRDSLVENVKEMVALVPALNLTNDSKMTDAAKEIEKQLASLDPNDLRENKVTRQAVAEKAAAIAARFGGMGKRKLANN
ncbi:MAG: hypothetical protein KGL39_27120 [Patescibacteria group bacterium]|nr:hypothetical protein [Patescibacteria group bacterium]